MGERVADARGVVVAETPCGDGSFAHELFESADGLRDRGVGIGLVREVVVDPPDAEPLEDYLGPIFRKHIDRIFCKPIRILGYQHQRIFGNWKLYSENTRDTYHGILLHEFQSITGEVRIQRGAETIWSKKVQTGEANMCHSLQNLEHHHFKFEGHRLPGDIHVHFFGAHSLSFGDGVALRDGDWMDVRFEGFGRPLRNPISVETKDTDRLIRIRSLA